MPAASATLSTSAATPVVLTSELGGKADVDRRPRRAWYLARAVVAVELTCYSVLGLLLVLEKGPTPGLLLLGVLCAAGLLAIQLFYFSRPSTRLDSRLSHWMLVPLACLVYLPLLPFGEAWIAMLGFLAGSALLVLRPAAGWTVFGAVTLSTIGIQAQLSGRLLDILYNTLSTALAGLTVLLLTRLARLVGELHSARTGLAKGAVAEERLRFAADLHDLLGLSLSAITLKCELLHRLILKHPDRARLELAEITETARRALSDVRAVARGYRELSLEQEFQAARALLGAAEVDLRLDLGKDELPVQVRTVLGTVLREGVTNVLRYGEVEHCEITVRQEPGKVSLEIVNDGVTPDDDTGLGDLAARVKTLGGTIGTWHQPDGKFRLHAELPVRDERIRLAGKRRERTPSALDSRLIQALVTVVLVGFGASASIHLLYLTRDFWQLATGIGYLAALLILQLTWFSRANSRLHSKLAYALLLVQACLVYLPMLQLKQNWVSLPGLLAGSALLVLPSAAGWAVFLTVVATVAGGTAGFTADIGGMPFTVIATINTGFLVFGLSWLTRVATDLDATRRRLAEMAVAEERLRFARDLHDLLGLSLSAIALKSELTDRLLVPMPDRAATEVEQIRDLARQALSDVRSVAGGYRELSLDNETRSVEAVLRAADVEVHLDLHHNDLRAPIHTVLAVVLREGVTNVLRHSNVEQCEIAVRQTGDTVQLDIVNDGVRCGSAGRVGGVASSGIHNLSDRVAMLGGKLTAGLDPDGRYRLRAVVPAS